MASILVENGTLTPGFIQFIVALTTLLMVIRFGLDALRHRSRGNVTQIVLATLDTVTHTMITYSLGIMQHRSATTSYYQLWAVLLVTLRYSVKIGRPAGIAMKQTPLVDLMSSFVPMSPWFSSFPVGCSGPSTRHASSMALSPPRTQMTATRRA